MTDSPVYTPDELRALGLRRFGEDVRISRRASVHGWEGLSLGDHVRIDDFCVLTAAGGIEIGSYVHLGAYCGIFGGSGILLEDYSGLSPRTLVFSESDDFSGESLVHPFFPRSLKPGYRSGPVVFRRFAQTGAGCTVLPGVTLGEGAATGAHALVTRDLEPWSIHVGTPARKWKDRSRTIVDLAARHRAGLP